MASENMCRIIAGRRVSPAALHQFVSHCISLSPHAPSFFPSVSPCSLFPVPSLNTHAQTHKPLWASWIFHAAGCIIPEACSSRPAHIRFHHLAPGERERERGRRRETGVVGGQKENRWIADRQKEVWEEWKGEEGGNAQVRATAFLPVVLYRHRYNREVCCLPSTVRQNCPPEPPHRPLADEEQFLKVSLYQKRLKLRLLDAFIRVRKSSFCHIKSFSRGCLFMTCNMTFFYVSSVSRVIPSNCIYKNLKDT